MQLTAAQLATIKADITANGDLNSQPAGSDGAFEIARLYNLPAATDFFGNYARVPTTEVMNAVTWKNYTPTDDVPTDTATNIAIHSARSNFAAAMQMNLQTMLIGRDTIDATKATMVAGLKDATNTSMPTGATGASQKGGWTNIQKILCRKGTRIEKLLADTTGGNGGSNTTAATFTFEGAISPDQVEEARNS